LRKIQFFGSLAEAELTCNCPEDYETKILETRHSMIRSPGRASCRDHRSPPNSNRRGILSTGHGRFGYSQADSDLWRSQQRAVTQAVMP